MRSFYEGPCCPPALSPHSFRARGRGGDQGSLRAGFPRGAALQPEVDAQGLARGGASRRGVRGEGRDIEEGLEAAQLLEKYGYDALDTDAGCYDAWWWNHPPMYQKKGLYREYGKLVKEVVDVPAILAGRMDDPDMAAASIEAGECDMVSLGRPLLADPDIVNKIRAGRLAEIRPYISCQEGCMGRVQEYSMINCAVNPQAARERATAYEPVVGAPKRVPVIGGGPAGCEAARALAVRGHKPELFEASDRLGGNLIPGGMPDFKEDDRALAAWYATELDMLGVPVHLGHAVSADEARDPSWDAVIVATGSKPKLFSLGDDEHTYAAEQVLLGREGAPAGRFRARACD